VLLRGINVGRNKRIAMQDLRAVLAGLGYQDVATLLQSGNAVFTSARRQAGAVAGEIEQGISRELGLSVPCVVRSAAELAAVIAANPFTVKVSEGSRLLVSFLSGPVDRARLAGLDLADFAPDEVHVGDREIYAWLPNGQAGSRIPIDFWDKRLGVVSTARNWNTVTKLMVLAQQAA
jgi:uncharacterized protein (DUF1697 family)